MVLLIDNYDSFSFNLYQLTGSILEETAGRAEIRVVRNDAIRLADIVVLRPSHIIISPGPGRPADAGICEEAIRAFTGKIPILGVCLGHQAICEAAGGVVTYAKRLVHGKAARLTLDLSCPIFAGLPPVIQGARYHSLAAAEATLPASLAVTARSEDGEVMAVRHKRHQVYGLQFHPESILTPQGKVIVKNFLALRENGGGEQSDS
jgi:anthranilate synthase component 2